MHEFEEEEGKEKTKKTFFFFYYYERLIVEWKIFMTLTHTEQLCYLLLLFKSFKTFKTIFMFIGIKIAHSYHINE